MKKISYKVKKIYEEGFLVLYTKNSDEIDLPKNMKIPHGRNLYVLLGVDEKTADIEVLDLSATDFKENNPIDINVTWDMFVCKFSLYKNRVYITTKEQFGKFWGEKVNVRLDKNNISLNVLQNSQYEVQATPDDWGDTHWIIKNNKDIQINTERGMLPVFLENTEYLIGFDVKDSKLWFTYFVPKKLWSVLNVTPNKSKPLDFKETKTFTGNYGGQVRIQINKNEEY